MKTNPAVDAYIGKAAPFARPILEKLRALFHRACPEIEETMKWSFPHFEYRGVVAGVAAFKQHATVGFWKASLMNDPSGLFDDDRRSGHGPGQVHGRVRPAAGPGPARVHPRGNRPERAGDEE